MFKGSKKYEAIHAFRIILILLLLYPLVVVSTPADFESRRKEIDSLLKILPGKKDTARVDILLRLSTIYLSVSMDSSREYARLALKDSKSIEDSRRIAESYKLLGNVSYYQGAFDEVVNFYDSSLIQFKLADDSFGQAKVLNNLGIVYHYLGDYRTSIDYYLKSLDFKASLRDSIGIANTNNNIGSIYYDLKEYQKAYEYFLRALNFSEKVGYDNSTQGILNNMGLISQEMGQHQKAVELFNESLAYGAKTDNILGTADTYHNLGKSKVMLGKYREGLEYYNKALEIYRELGVSEAQTLNNIGQAYIELDYYNQALNFLSKALEEALLHNRVKLLRDIYQNLSVAYERMGRFEKAYFNYLKFNQYDDSLRSQNYLNKIEDISNRHEIEKSQEQIDKARLALEKKESELRRRNYVIYSVIAGLIAALAFAVVLFRMGLQKQRVNKKLLQQNEEVMRSQVIIKKINKALTENEEKLRSIFDVSPYSILVLDANNKIVDCNGTSLELFNLSNKRELLEKSIETLIAEPVEGTEPISILENIRKNNLNRTQYTLTKMDLSTFQAEITGRVIWNPQGEIDAYIIVINDITERLNFVESLKEAKLNAEESDRLKTAFLANMSHEIRTPMNSIVGFSNLLNDPNLKGEKRHEFLQHILQSSNLLLNLIDDIIDISKIEAGQMSVNVQQVIVNEVVKDTFAAFSESNENKNLKFRIKIPRGTDSVQSNTDPMRLRQILTNLLSNAVKFTPDGTIELGYKLNPEKNRPNIEFYLKDTGIGIQEDKLDLIFERFRQVDDSQSRKYGGTGLGLAISKRLVELLGGTIWVESKPGKGSIFYFTIPYLLPDDKLMQSQQFDSKKYNWKGRKILIAEDENSNFELIKAALTNTGIQILRAHNGEEAVDQISGGDKVDLILMDIRMPKMNGYDATRQIKKINNKIPIVAITAYAMSEDEAKSLKAGCDKYLSKPIRPLRLLELIDELLS